MNSSSIIIAITVLVVIGGLVLLSFLFILPSVLKDIKHAREVQAQARKTPEDPAEKLEALIHKSIGYEDEFIETYMKVLRDEGFMIYFGDAQPEAKRLMNLLIEESRGHKSALQEVLIKIK